MKDYITFCKDIYENYKVLIASEELKETYANKEQYSKKEWIEDLACNGYEEIKTIVKDL